MLIRQRRAEHSNTTGKRQERSKTSSVPKGQPYFHNSSPIASSKSVPLKCGCHPKKSCRIYSAVPECSIVKMCSLSVGRVKGWDL